VRTARLLVLPVALAVVLPVAAEAPAAKRCKKYKEKSGCKLPAPAGYASTGNLFTLTVGKPASDANGRFGIRCTGGGRPDSEAEVEWPIDERLNFPGRPKVGQTYDVEALDTNPPDGSGRVSSYEWRGKLVIKSAKKATLTLSYKFSNGNDAVGFQTCTGEQKRTLRRVRTL
jgi:hypothetical protein